MCLLAKFLKQLLKVIAGYKGKINLVRRKNSDFLPHDSEFEFCFVSRCLATPVTASLSPTPTRWKLTVPDLSLALSYLASPPTLPWTHPRPARLRSRSRSRRRMASFPREASDQTEMEHTKSHTFHPRLGNRTW